MNGPTTVNIDPAKTILFVGAGVSTILGLPSWQGLIDQIAAHLGYDPRVFRLLGNHLSLAEFYKLERGSIGPLRSWLDVEWHKDVDVSKSPVHEAIVTTGFRKIYTTNFDRCIELACESWGVPYKKILTVNDLASDSGSDLEVVKFHGDVDDDDTIVLTESSYYERLDFESPIDSLLRADVLRYPVLFIGYSLSDINVRYLLHKLSVVWREAGLSDMRPESFIFMGNPNPVAEKIFRNWGITPLVGRTQDLTAGLGDFLRSIQANSAFG